MKKNTLFKVAPEFVIGVARADQLPTDRLTEIAFAGRSNVGKSSLINAVVGAKIARSSNTPGRTQQLNYFRADNFYIVDLPGYGYAKASKKEVQGWTGLVIDYLCGRAMLRRVFLLIDARHGIKPIDEETMKMLDKAAVSYQVVLTKADKISAAELKEIEAKTVLDAQKHVACYPEILVTSAEKRVGIESVQKAIEVVVG